MFAIPLAMDVIYLKWSLTVYDSSTQATSFPSRQVPSPFIFNVSGADSLQNTSASPAHKGSPADSFCTSQSPHAPRQNPSHRPRYAGSMRYGYLPTRPAHPNSGRPVTDPVGRGCRRGSWARAASSRRPRTWRLCAGDRRSAWRA